ncbi:MAG: peptide MFS transporter [Simkaniaceae bacterium]|nr:peptide MFS transporter [Simkaniaceae bacterium]
MNKEIGYLKSHPAEMFYLALTEMSQRFAFWGVGNILVLYLVQYFHFTDASATHLYGLYTGVSFVLPLFGGYLADRWNYSSPVWSGMIASALGCFCIGTALEPLLYVGLILIGLGGCVFTPCVYSLLNRFYKEKHHLRTTGFSIYYAGVNIGTFVGMIALGPLVLYNYWKTVFCIAGLVQLLGLFAFRKVNELIKEEHLSVFKERVKEKAEMISRTSLHRIAVILVVSFFSIVFWAAYNQQFSSIVLFALNYTDLQCLGFTIPIPWIITSQTFFLVILAIPLSSLYLFLKKHHLELSPPTKMALSFIATAICFGLIVLASRHIPGASPLYLISGFFFMAIAELLIAPIGLAFVTKLSPKKMTAFFVGVYYLCIGVGFYLGGWLAGFMQKEHVGEFFLKFGIVVLVTGLILLSLAKTLTRFSHQNKVDAL